MTGAALDVAHPARYSPEVIAALAPLLGGRVLDPFAGPTGVQRLLAARPELDITGVELEPEWAAAGVNTITGDACALPWPDGTFDTIATSPAYGNRMADQYAGDAAGSRRHTYRVALGRDLTDGSGAALQWGSAYRQLHRRAVDEILRVAKPGGLVIVNMSDHVRAGVTQHVVGWWITTLARRGLNVQRIIPVETRRQRHGANGDARAEHEVLIVGRTPGAKALTLFGGAS